MEEGPEAWGEWADAGSEGSACCCGQFDVGGLWVVKQDQTIGMEAWGGPGRNRESGSVVGRGRGVEGLVEIRQGREVMRWRSRSRTRSAQMCRGCVDCVWWLCGSNSVGKGAGSLK